MAHILNSAASSFLLKHLDRKEAKVQGLDARVTRLVRMEKAQVVHEH